MCFVRYRPPLRCLNMDDFKPIRKSLRKAFDIGIEYIMGSDCWNCGSYDQRINIIGDTVNTARIEAANKDADTRLLISEDCYELVKDRVEEDFIWQKLRAMSQKSHFTK